MTLIRTGFRTAYRSISMAIVSEGAGPSGFFGRGIRRGSESERSMLLFGFFLVQEQQQKILMVFVCFHTKLGRIQFYFDRHYTLRRSFHNYNWGD